MIVTDPGHAYLLTTYDGEGHKPLVFMKREGPGFPGNVGHYPGTNCQEVLRALIDRVKYLDGQVPCEENVEILTNLRSALVWFEARAARRHGLEVSYLVEIEDVPTCSTCGHVVCKGHSA